MRKNDVVATYRSDQHAHYVPLPQREHSSRWFRYDRQQHLEPLTGERISIPGLFSSGVVFIGDVTRRPVLENIMIDRLLTGRGC